MKQVEPHPCSCSYIFDKPDLGNKYAHLYQKTEGTSNLFNMDIGQGGCPCGRF